jgi:1-deoxy-D-xylulose-5-phosphate synthase
MNFDFKNFSSLSELKNLPVKDLPEFCNQLRQFLLHEVSQSGGHLASNLGTVELTVALHYVFDSPVDTFCWDVGHQTYCHKILTGRASKMGTIRKAGGLSGFPRREESLHDHYNVGHAGTAISQAMAEAVSRDIKKKINPEIAGKNIIAVVGDASIVAGMSFEALNHAGYTKNPFLVILNDNEMSISQNTGALSYYFNRIISTSMYKSWRSRWLSFLRWIPLIGIIIERLALRTGSTMKSLVTNTQFFEELGFRYLGPLDGHNITQLVSSLEQLKHLQEPTLLHIVTKKGKGYELAENDPITYHGVIPFKTTDGIKKKSSDSISFSLIVGNTLSKLAENDPHLVAVTPAMKEGSGLVPFADKFPANFFDCGIAEQHAVTFTGGLAKSGLNPFLCIYSTFLQRGYDQLIHDICLMNFPVKLIMDRAGCVGGDGETHQGLYDFAFLSPIPNLIQFSATSEQELIRLLKFASKYNDHPLSIRVAKQSGKKSIMKSELDRDDDKFNPFQAQVLKEGSDILLLAEGTMVQKAMDSSEVLNNQGFSTTVINLRCLKPLDKITLNEAAKGKSAIFTIENHVLDNGIGSYIYQMIDGLSEVSLFKSFGYPCLPIEHGNIEEIEELYSLSSKLLTEQMLIYLEEAGIKKSYTA